jgi:hypothetical protein
MFRTVENGKAEQCLMFVLARFSYRHQQFPALPRGAGYRFLHFKFSADRVWFLCADNRSY